MVGVHTMTVRRPTVPATLTDISQMVWDLRRSRGERTPWEFQVCAGANAGTEEGGVTNPWRPPVDSVLVRVTGDLGDVEAADVDFVVLRSGLEVARVTVPAGSDYGDTGALVVPVAFHSNHKLQIESVSAVAGKVSVHATFRSVRQFGLAGTLIFGAPDGGGGGGG